MSRDTSKERSYWITQLRETVNLQIISFEHRIQTHTESSKAPIHLSVFEQSFRILQKEEDRKQQESSKTEKRQRGRRDKSMDKREP